MIGSKLGNRYELKSLLGRGGMGVVYLAHDPVLDRDVAVKLIAPSVLSPEIEARFTREARVVAKMDHASIVGVYDFGAHDGSLFFVMPFVPGTTLRAWLRKEPVRLGDAIDVAIQAASALDYSHALGVVHRDIKPENMMVVRDGDSLRVRITDFGLAFTANENRITRTGSLMGSVSYFSPEQVAGRTIDPRSDIYSLGIVLYECLVGAAPFVGDMHSVLYRIVNELITPARTMAPNVPADLDAIVMQCVAKNPAERPQRAKEIVDALTRLRASLDDNARALIVADTVITNDSQTPAGHVRQPLVGREKEYGELQKRLVAAMAGESQLVVLSGEAGIGKTRLLDALETLAAAKSVPVLRSGFAEVHQAFPYQAYYDLLYAHLRSTSSSAALVDLTDLMPDLVALFPALAELEIVRSATSANLTAPRSGSTDQAYLFDVLARTFARIGGGKPLILMLDDLHASTMSLDALQYIVLRLGPTPTLIVGAYTDTDVDKAHPLTKLLDGMKGSRRFASVPLGRFTPSEHRLFVENLVGSSRLDPGLVQQLHDTAEGNPYVTKEILRALMDSGSVAKDASGEWSLSLEREISADDLPATLQEAVEKRLERLADEPKQILTLASVLGRSFDLRDLEAIADDAGDLDRALDALLVAGFLQEERASRGDRLAFTSGVVCDAVYKAMPRRKKRGAHLKAAEAIEARAKGRLERVYAQLLFHYVRGDATEKVRDLGLKQARHALASLLVDDAIEAAKSVLTFLDDEDGADVTLEAECREVLASAYRMKGQFDSALKETEAAIKLHETRKDIAARLRAIVTAAEIAWDARRVQDVKRWIERGLDAATAAADHASLRKLLLLGTTIANLRGEFELARGYQLQLQAVTKDPVAEATPLARGGTLHVGFTVDARATRPSEIARDVEVEILANVFETLVTTDAYGQLAPQLCTHWETQDSATFVLSLRQDVRFHDGHLMTAADVKASLESTGTDEVPTVLIKPRADTEVTTARRITVLDDHTLRIELPEPLPIFPALLTSPQMAIARDGAGTGPFVLAEIDRGRYRLTRNDDYYASSPRLDALEMRGGLTAAQIASELRAGTLDVAGDLTSHDLDELLRDRRRGLTIVETIKKNICYALFNTRNGRCATAVVREVLADTIRPNELIWQSLGRFAQPALGIIPPGILGHDAGRRRHTLSRDQAVAKLETAGVTFPILIRAAVHPLLLDRYRALADALFAAWSELGISVVVGTHDMTTFLQAFQDPERFDLIISRYIADYDDPDAFTYGFFHSSAGDQRQFFSDADFDQLSEEARASTSPAAREKLYRRAEQLLLAKHVVLPLFHEVDYRLLAPAIRGATLRAVPPYVNYAALAKSDQPASSPAPRIRGGVLTIPMHHSVRVIDIARSPYNWLDDILRLVFEPLTMIVEGEGIGPCLASEFRAEEGGRRYRFWLRDGVRFHDGRRITARDVRGSWERTLLSEDSDQQPLLFPIKGARALARHEAQTLAGFEIVSPGEFVITLDESLAMFPALLATVVGTVIPEQGFRPSTSWREGCVGTGPFRIVRFEPGRSLELEANPHYWRAGQPRAEGIIFNFDVARPQVSTELQDGRASFIMDISAADIARFRGQPALAKGYHAVPSLSTLTLYFNSRRGVLANEALRHELVAAIDVAGMVRRHAGAVASPARSFTPPGFLGHEPRAPKPRTAFPARTEPIELTAMATANVLDLFGAIARELTDALALRGFRVKFSATPDSPGVTAARGDCDILFMTWAADFPDVDGMLHGSLLSTDSVFGPFLGTPEVDRILTAARRELDPVARQGMYRSLEAILADRALLLPILHKTNHGFVQPGVRGGERAVTMMGFDFSQLWLDG